MSDKDAHTAMERLATYGTLAPGEKNHHELSALTGRWRAGRVKGRLVDDGWGAAHGCPAIILDPAADEVSVQVLESHDLPDHWPRLDAFEGDEYARTVTRVETQDGSVEASIYVLKTP